MESSSTYLLSYTATPIPVAAPLDATPDAAAVKKPRPPSECRAPTLNPNPSHTLRASDDFHSPQVWTDQLLLQAASPCQCKATIPSTHPHKVGIRKMADARHQVHQYTPPIPTPRASFPGEAITTSMPAANTPAPARSGSLSLLPASARQSTSPSPHLVRRGDCNLHPCSNPSRGHGANHVIGFHPWDSQARHIHHSQQLVQAVDGFRHGLWGAGALGLVVRVQLVPAETKGRVC